MDVSIVTFGAYDTRKPRVRLLLQALRDLGVLDQEILIRGWEDVQQTNIPSKPALMLVLLRMIASYPLALLKLLRTKRGAAILLPYPGIVEILLVAPFAKLLGRKIILDAFLPIYDTIVMDRRLAKQGALRARLIHWFEKTAMHRADVVLVDTDSHGAYFEQEFSLPSARFVTVLVGAEKAFQPAAKDHGVDDILGPPGAPPIILFYGQLIPLHGVPTILQAAKLYSGPPARWIIIGKGQLEPLVKEHLAADAQRSFDWIEWVDYDRLPSVIARADICLGVFGKSDKAARVIPNKVFQQLAVGKPVITRASPAMDPIAQQFPAAVHLIAPDDPHALANAAERLLSDKGAAVSVNAQSLEEFSPLSGAKRLVDLLAHLKDD